MSEKSKVEHLTPECFDSAASNTFAPTAAINRLLYQRIHSFPLNMTYARFYYTI